MPRNKSKKFLKQKQGNQKKRSKFQVKSPEEIAKSNPELFVRSEVESVRDTITTTTLSNSSISSNLNSLEFDSNYENEFNDIISISSDVSGLNNSSIININETMDELLENLNEKDGIMRQTTLHRINRLLRQNVECDDYLRAKSCNNLYTLLLLIKDCLSHGETKLQCIALETISLLMISLNDNHDIVEKIVYSIILKLIKKPQSIQTQIQSINTLTCMVWSLKDAQKKTELLSILSDIWTHNDTLNSLNNANESFAVEYTEEFLQSIENNDNVDDLNQIMESLHSSPSEDNKTNDKEENDNNQTDNISSIFSISKQELNELIVGAIKNWSWLISSIDSDESIGELLEDYNKDLLHILEYNTDVEVRCAAGEALILLVSNFNNDNTNNIGSTINNNDIDIDEINAVFDQLANEKDVQRKNDLKQQKAVFKKYLDSSETGQLPKVNIKLRSKEYKREGWQFWIIYNQLKEILKEGFQLHLLKNEMIQSAMHINDFDSVEKLTQSEKRSKLMKHADDEKQNKQKRKGQRKQKQSFMFDHGDG